MNLFSVFNVKSTLVSVLALSTMLGACDLEAMKREREDTKKEGSISPVATKKHKVENKIPQGWAELPPETTLNIFQYLGQREISPVAQTCQVWNMLLRDNLLWYGYAKKGHVIMEDAPYNKRKNYKVLVHFHSVPNGYRLYDFMAADFDYTGTVIAGTLKGRPGIAYLREHKNGFLCETNRGLNIEYLSHSKVSNYNFKNISDNASFVFGDNLYQLQTGGWFFNEVNFPAEILRKFEIMSMDASGSLILGKKKSKVYVWDRRHDKVHDLNISHNLWLFDYHKLFDASGELITAAVKNEGKGHSYPAFWKYNREIGEIEGPFGLINPIGQAHALPLSVSSDGNVIVGASREKEESIISRYPIAMRWVKNKEGQFDPEYLDLIYYLNLKGFPGRCDQSSEAKCVNYDGSVIGGKISNNTLDEEEGGYDGDTTDEKAFIWTPENNLQILNDIKKKFNYSFVDDVDFTNVLAVTPSGHVFIVRGGSYHHGFQGTRWEDASWLIVLPRGPLF